MNNNLKSICVTIALIATFSKANDNISEKRLLIDDKLKATVWQAKDTRIKGIILISHGFASKGSAMMHYAKPFANAGYLVGAITHSDILNLKTNKPENDPMLIRQRHLAKLLSTLKTNNANLPVGLLGYSIGGFSVLTATGYQSQLDAQPAYCQTDAGKSDEIICNPLFNSRMAAITAKKIDNEVNLNADAVVALAPAYLPLIKQSAQTIPTLVIYGEQDEFIPPKTVSMFTDNQKNVTSELLPNVGHFAYLESCQFDNEICKDPKPIDRQAIQKKLVTTVITFFDKNMAK